MSITPEEIVNRQTWKILQNLKEKSLVPKEDGSFFYDTTGTVIVAGENSPDQERKRLIIQKLSKEKAIKIMEDLPPNWKSSRNGFYLKVLQPNFDETYNRYRKACDLTSYLQEYQDRMTKGNDTLEFNQVENIKVTPPTPTKHTGQMFPTSSGGGYYNRNHPTNPVKRLSASKIVEEFSPPNYPFVLMVIEGILSASEFGSDGEANYQLRSPSGQILVRERQLLSKFEKLGLFKHLGEDGMMGIAELRNIDTKTMKQMVIEIKNKQLNTQTKPEEKSGYSKTKYNQLLEKINQPNRLENIYDKTLKEVSFKKNDQKKLIDEKKIECCGLFYSFRTNQLIYTGGVKDISPETRQMKFFLTLYRKKGETVDYKTIAKEANLHLYKELSEDGEISHQDLHNKDFSDEASLLRRDFREIVLSLGMSAESFSKMIKTIKKTGYKLICR